MSTFPKFLLANKRNIPEAPAIREKKLGIWHTLTWGQLADEVRIIAAALLLEGVQRGDRVALLGENRPRLFSAMVASRSGALCMHALTISTGLRAASGSGAVNNS